MSDPYDTAFAHAVRSAANGDGRELAKLLCSDMPLGAGEREMLAALVRGDLDKRAGRPTFGVGAPHIAAAVLYYRQQTELFGEESAATDTANRIGKSLSTIREWARLTREREVEIARLKKLPRK